MYGGWGVGLEFPTLGMELEWGGRGKGKSGHERVHTDVNILLLFLFSF